MATARLHHASMARAAIRRPYPRQEPSALDAHAGICAGGRPNPQGPRAVPTATEDQDRTLQAQARHAEEADASEAARGQGRAAATHAPARPRSGALAAKCAARALQLLRRARQQRGAVRLPPPGSATLAALAIATQPARLRDLGADGPHRRSLASAGPHPASLARSALRRHDPRQEPSELTLTLGSVRGAARRLAWTKSRTAEGQSLPRPIGVEVTPVDVAGVSWWVGCV